MSLWRPARNSQTKPLSSDRLIAAHAQLLAVRQYHQMITMEPGVNFFNPVHVNEARSMDSLEVAPAEFLLQAGQRFTDFIGVGARMHAHVIPFCFNPVDIPCRHESNAPMLGDRQSINTFILFAEVLQHRHEALSGISV